MKTVYVIKKNGKRFNSKNFDSYEDARKYVRRLLTKINGMYSDSFSDYGFKIEARQV